MVSFLPFSRLLRNLIACSVKLQTAAAAARTDLVALFGIARRFGPKNWIFVADDAARKLFSHKSPPEAKPGGGGRRETEDRRLRDLCT